MKFLATLFFIILIFYLISLIGRAMLRVWVVRNAREFSNGSRQSGRTERKREGKVTIETARYQNEKRIRSDVGDYVEYEEIIEEKEK